MCRTYTWTLFFYIAHNMNFTCSINSIKFDSISELKSFIFSLNFLELTDFITLLFYQLYFMVVVLEFSLEYPICALTC